MANVVEIIAILSIFEKPNFLATNEKKKHLSKLHPPNTTMF